MCFPKIRKTFVSRLSGNQLTARRKFRAISQQKSEGMLEKVLGTREAVVRVPPK